MRGLDTWPSQSCIHPSIHPFFAGPRPGAWPAGRSRPQSRYGTCWSPLPPRYDYKAQASEVGLLRWSVMRAYAMQRSRCVTRQVSLPPWLVASAVALFVYLWTHFISFFLQEARNNLTLICSSACCCCGHFIMRNARSGLGWSRGSGLGASTSLIPQFIRSDYI